ncbi:MAG: hypothetical protein K8R40_07790 [Anaerolineaceae bacterium]|nr:hypothetical protein [Anaerolineaceae bacterium]
MPDSDFFLGSNRLSSSELIEKEGFGTVQSMRSESEEALPSASEEFIEGG